MLQTQKPLHQLRGAGLEVLLPREGGPGDYRPVPPDRTDGVRVYHTAGFYGGDLSTGYGYRLRYSVRRNNLPVLGPYVYGASRETRSFRNLDLKAIEKADREFDGRTSRRPFTDDDREQILALRALNPRMTQFDIASVTGCSTRAVSTVLREAKAAEQARAVQRERLVAAGGGRRMRPADLAVIRGTG